MYIGYFYLLSLGERVYPQRLLRNSRNSQLWTVFFSFFVDRRTALDMETLYTLPDSLNDRLHRALYVQSF